MKTIVVTDHPRASIADAARLGEYGAATVHEAAGRVGYLGPRLRPAWPGARIGGTAVTVLCWPGDNLMIHVAVEQCREGDVLVVATNSPCSDGLFGELFATALQRRGVRGVVLSCGVRDVAELREMEFPGLVDRGERPGIGEGDAWGRECANRGGGSGDLPRRCHRRRRRRRVCVPRDEVGKVLTRPAARVRARRRPAARRSAVASWAWTAIGLRDRLGEWGIDYVSYADHLANEAAPMEVP